MQMLFVQGHLEHELTISDCDNMNYWIDPQTEIDSWTENKHIIFHVQMQERFFSLNM